MEYIRINDGEFWKREIDIHSHTHTHTKKSATPVAGLRPFVPCAYVQLLLLLLLQNRTMLRAYRF